ncbi:MAG: hypothetical protein J7L11_05255 [Thermoprotei archaeon]|nr:hypothetical protein [Thermoprotei archaeon]
MREHPFKLRVKEEFMSVIARIRQSANINGETNTWLRTKYGDKYSRALETMARGGVKLYRFMPSTRTIWIVEGHERDYLVIPFIYCDCEDFYLNVVIRRKDDICYHMLAQALADALGSYTLVELPDELYERFLEEWLF